MWVTALSICICPNIEGGRREADFNFLSQRPLCLLLLPSLPSLHSLIRQTHPSNTSHTTQQHSFPQKRKTHVCVLFRHRSHSPNNSFQHSTTYSHTQENESTRNSLTFIHSFIHSPSIDKTLEFLDSNQLKKQQRPLLFPCTGSKHASTCAGTDRNVND